ncbi:SDR family oxidoreductase [Candidatus Bipolaricaulota bacterium]|nr:SDR family oxidoreductase [Candidatus Bipolaricaulota bacterium]
MEIVDNFDLSGKVVVLTGGAGVLCSEMARALVDAGAKVAILDVDEESMAQLEEEAESDGSNLVTIETNVLDKKSLESAADKIKDRWGRIDVLINGAGGNSPKATTGEDQSFFDLPEEGVQQVFNLNFLGTFLASQVFGEVFVEQGEGIILNISSMNAFTPLTKIPAYSAAKAAVSNFTQWLAVHMSQNYSPDIRVNAIAPGFLLTEQNRYLLIDEETGDLTERGQTIIDHTPMGEFGDPEDLLTTVFWLLEDGSKFVHGTVIPIDGGFSAFSGV